MAKFRYEPFSSLPEQCHMLGIHWTGGQVSEVTDPAALAFLRSKPRFRMMFKEVAADEAIEAVPQVKRGPGRPRKVEVAA